MDEEIKIEDTLPPVEEDFKDKYFRGLAEMENMRKRMAKEKQEMVRFGIENAIAEFLPVIDQFEQALEFANNADPAVKNWATGFQMFLAQFKEVLSQNGITSYVSLGEMFDPNYHEAVEAVENLDVPEGQILQEFTKGYKGPIRVVRPARVKVAKHPADTSAPEELFNPKENNE